MPAVVLREAAEAAALNEPRHADGQAPPALHVAAPACRHGIVRIAPKSTGPNRDRRLWRLLAFASSPDECFLHGDVLHLPSPNQKGIGRAGRALVAVAATFDDQAQIVLARKVDGRDDVRERLPNLKVIFVSGYAERSPGYRRRYQRRVPR